MTHSVHSTLLSAFRPRAVVFDLDGTLVDNLPLHAEAFGLFARRHGLPLPSVSDRVRWNGKRNSEIFPDLFGRPLEAAEWRAFEEEKEAYYRALSKGRLSPMPGALRLLDRLDAHGIPYAVATSAPEKNVTHTLDELDLARRLPVVVRGDQVRRGKPHPDVFLEAAARLGIAPAACLAFEDAPAGIEAAKAADMRCVGIARPAVADHLLLGPVQPDDVVETFDDFLAGAGAWLTGGVLPGGREVSRPTAPR